MRRMIWGLLVCLGLSAPLMAQDGKPVVSDSRIKTFVYNENDVYKLKTHYGYQSNIEFSRAESIETVSVGDRVSWQVIPAGRRLFIKAMEENAHTNMTVVTNKRAYQFDLRSSGRQPLHPNEELVYVVRFFYPEDQRFEPKPPIYSDAVAGNYRPYQVASVGASPTTQAAAPVTAVSAQASAPARGTGPANPQLNFNYTYTGPSEAAPVKIYDDGRNTYFTFARSMDASPQFFVLSPDGQEQPVQPSYNAQGEAVIATVAPRFSIRRGDANIKVFNENFSNQRAM